MNIFARIKNLFTGFLSLFIDGIEKNNPEIAYQNAIDDLMQKFDRARNAVAAIVAERMKLEARLSASQHDLEGVTSDLNAALDTNADDLAEILVQKQEALKATIASVTTDLTTASSEAESAKSSLLQLKAEIEKLKTEKNTMLARNATAQARLAIQDQLDGISVDAELHSLQNVRDGINNTVAKANLSSEMAGSDLDHRLAKLHETSGAISAKSKVAAMKAARAAAQTKSM
jgi:phage shock protein A